MKKITAIFVLCLCLVPSGAWGQIASDRALPWRDSVQTAPRQHRSFQDNSCLNFGKALLIGGGTIAAAGGGFILYAYSTARHSTATTFEESLGEGMGIAIMYILGLEGILVGSVVAFSGVPFTVAGCQIGRYDGNWHNARYDERGFGTIIEGGYALPDIIQVRATVGYHFNPYIFLGGGIAPGVGLDKSNHVRDIGDNTWEEYNQVYLPVYANFRWSPMNRMVSPYLGISAGMDVIEVYPYLAAELGTRIHTRVGSNRSFWSSIYGEVSGCANVGIKMGYSF